MYAVLQKVFPFVFFGLWFGVSALMYLRLRHYQRSYLRRFPPVDGVPLDMYVGGNPFGNIAQAINRAMKNRQEDPELESLRRDVWRRYRFVLLWIFGFPLLTFVVLMALALSGHTS